VASVLVIDDEKMILGLVEQALTMFDFQVDTAYVGADGIRKFNHGNYDLVITDVCMPEVDGNVIIHHIRNSQRKGTPVIGISGTPWLLKSNDFDHILPKPFGIKTLIDTAKSLTAM
jgi:DNA-binding response OmpR family regulator